MAADLITRGVPVVCSSEVPWMPRKFHADPSSALSIAEKMKEVFKSDTLEELEALKSYSDESKSIWVDKMIELFILAIL